MWPSPQRPWEHVRALADHAEATGWDGMYFADHFMPNDMEGDRPLDGDVLECWSVIAATAPIDNISNGRVVLGLGAGWQANEHRAYGIDLHTTKARLDRFEEACAIV